MLFKDFSQYLEKIQGISSRLKIIEVLADLVKQMSSEESDKGVYLMLGNLGPEYKSVEFMMAEKMVMRSVARTLGVDLDWVLREYKEKGDLGEVILSKERKGKDLSLCEVHDRLMAIAVDEGGDSQERKVGGLTSLLMDLDQISAKFVVRIVLGKLRLGFSAKTVLDVLSVVVNDRKMKKEIERVYQVMPDIGLLTKRIKIMGAYEVISKFSPEVGVPVNPMLCQRIKSPMEMVKKMGPVAIEPKFDGTRIQIHFKRKGNEVSAWTRNLKEVSWMFPELLDMGKWVMADELILDSEAVGMDAERKAMVDFQTTMQRRRKHNIGDFRSRVPIRFYVFDVMFKDGENLMDRDYISRRKILCETVIDGELFQVDDYWLTEDAEMIADYHRKMLAKGLEGVIVKQIESNYVPGRTAWRWVKMKEMEESLSKLSDTIDGVVMGFSVGKGKRAGFGVGKFLVGVRDGEKIKTITKVGTGLTDEQFRELKRRLDVLVVVEKPVEYLVHKILEPDVWVLPQLVVEIAADEITKSPNHTAGVALRFPRLVKFRDDKDIDGVTTLAEVREIKKD